MGQTGRSRAKRRCEPAPSNKVRSIRRLVSEAERNAEVTGLTCRGISALRPIARFGCRKGEAMRATCRQFVALREEAGPIAGRRRPRTAGA